MIMLRHSQIIWAAFSVQLRESSCLQTNAWVGDKWGGVLGVLNYKGLIIGLETLLNSQKTHRSLGRAIP